MVAAFVAASFVGEASTAVASAAELAPSTAGLQGTPRAGASTAARLLVGMPEAAVTAAVPSADMPEAVATAAVTAKQSRGGPMDPASTLG
jgi:hypothetical protein